MARMSEHASTLDTGSLSGYVEEELRAATKPLTSAAIAARVAERFDAFVHIGDVHRLLREWNRAGIVDSITVPYGTRRSNGTHRRRYAYVLKLERKDPPPG